MSDRSSEEIVDHDALTQYRPHERAAQKALAEELTALVHSPAALTDVQAASAALFGRGDIHALSDDVLAAASAEVPSAAVPRAEFESWTAVELLIATGLAKSKNGRASCREQERD